MKRPIRICLIFLVATSMSSCFHGTTSQTIRVDDTNGALEPAAIKFTAPSVFGRESLIADRIRENTFLEGRLNNTVNETFGAQIMRDIQAIRTFSASLGIGFDPLGKQSIASAQSLGDLQQQIDVVKMQADLFRVKKAYEDLQAGSGTGPATPAKPDKPTESTRKGDTDKVLKALADLEAKLQVPNSTQRSGTTPELTFRDQQAFRSEVRSAIAANALDDTHDVTGNTLYRLAFRIQILPGNETQRARFGFARFVLQRPTRSPDEDEMKGLYFDWLTYLNGKLAAASLDYNTRNSTVTELYNLSKSMKFFQLVVVEDGKGRCYFKATVPDDTVRQQSADSTQWSVFIKGQNVNLAPTATTCTEDSILASAAEGDRASVPSKKPKPAAKSPKKAGAPDPEARAPSIRLFYRAVGIAREEGFVPKAFIDFVEREELTASARVYSMMPVMRDQRMSSVSSVLSAIQLAAGVSASLPSTGAGLEAGIGAANKAASRVDTIERIPAIISLSGESTFDSSVPWAGWVIGPQVLIRPGEQGKEIELRHSVIPHEVSIDVAVPAWRRKLRIDAQAAWVGTWAGNGPDVIRQLDDDPKVYRPLVNGKPQAVAQPASQKPAAEKPVEKDKGDKKNDAELPAKVTYLQDSFEIELAPTNASLAALTRRMTHKSRVVGLTQPTIYRVVPEKLRACDDTVSFMVQGDHLWRRPEVYIEGVKHADLQVLPDMQGLSVNFEGKRFVDFVGLKTARLEVVTREGTATALRESEGVIQIEACPAEKPAPKEKPKATTPAAKTANQANAGANKAGAVGNGNAAAGGQAAGAGKTQDEQAQGKTEDKSGKTADGNAEGKSEKKGDSAKKDTKNNEKDKS